MGKPLLKENEVPSGGIADFIMTSEEIKQIEALEAREQFGDSGIANFEEVASRMSSYGRFGDDTVAHLQKGEIIVPKALIEQNPVLKESIFNHLKELGIEDPERYVVGSSANSINPDTGMPEFFLGKILKGVKNIFKKVGKVLKKAAPTIGAILLTPVFGPVFGAALGSGLGTLVAGGSGKDALKAALFAGVTGGITTGVTGGIDSLGTALNPSAMLKQAGTFGKAFLENPITAYTGGTYLPKGDSIFGGKEAVDSTNVIGKGGSQFKKSDFANIPERSISTINEQAKTFADASQLSTPPKTPFLELSAQDQRTKLGDWMFRGGLSEDQVAENVLKAGDAYKTKFGKLATEKGLQEAMDAAKPGFLAKYGPTVAAGTGIMAATGMFDTPKDEEVEYTTGQQLLEENPDKYMLDPEAYKLKYLTNQNFGIPTQYASTAYVDQINNPFLNPQFQQPVQNVKYGGEIFPRRTGGIAPDEGVAGKDSVRAMLMPGEFVMTTNAVKGMGNGDLNQGINNMYGMMRNLESRGRMMA
jgi:hypothetical protein